MRISIIGTGYVGLVSGACLAELGHQVTCVDLDASKIDAIRQGRAPFYEAGLDDLLRAHIGGRLTATTDLAAAVQTSEVTLICVGTPTVEGQIDLSWVAESARQIGRAVSAKDDYHVVAVKSTVVPGTTDTAVREALEDASGRRAGDDFGLGMNPEFLTEGQAVDDFKNPDRIVLGGIDVRTREVLARLYAGFDGVPLLAVNNRTAEMIKYASNAMLATQISFANEIANLCEAVGGVDVAEVTRGVHLSHYLSPRGPDGTRLRAPLASFLEAGCGFGGSCLPKDVAALASQGKELGQSTPMLDAVLSVNRGRPERMVARLDRHFESLEGVPVAVLGLAFKPGTDDMRESPALPVVRTLLERGARVTVFDPVARETAREALRGLELEFSPSLEEAVDAVRAVLLVTRWPDFQRLHDLVPAMSPEPVVVDGRRVLDPRRFQRYEGIGRS